MNDKCDKKIIRIPHLLTVSEATINRIYLQLGCKKVWIMIWIKNIDWKYTKKYTKKYSKNIQKNTNREILMNLSVKILTLENGLFIPLRNEIYEV